MDICQVCPGAGGAFAVGACSGCQRLCCNNHLVLRATWGYNGSVKDVRLTLANGFEWADLSKAAKRYGGGANAYVEAWMRGDTLCDHCRGEAAARAGQAVATQQAAQAVEIRTATEAFRQEADAGALIKMINAGVEADDADFVRAWRLIAPTVRLRRSHDIVGLQAQGYKGHGTPKEVSRVAVWEIKQAVNQDVGTSDESMFRDFDAYICPEGRIWIDGVLDYGFLLPDKGKLQLFVLSHGAAVSISHKWGDHSSRVLGSRCAEPSGDIATIVVRKMVATLSR